MHISISGEDGEHSSIPIPNSLGSDEKVLIITFLLTKGRIDLLILLRVLFCLCLDDPPRLGRWRPLPGVFFGSFSLALASVSVCPQAGSLLMNVNPSPSHISWSAAAAHRLAEKGSITPEDGGWPSWILLNLPVLEQLQCLLLQCSKGTNVLPP